ncbi:MAG: hypothetical protein ACI4EX_04580 [Lachnospiraceae bacterium]
MGKEIIREKVSCATELEFVTEVANDCVTNMKAKDREYLINNPYAIDYHFSYCLYIRNHYIHNKDFSEVNFWAEPDHLSSQIIRMIFYILIPGYLYDDSFTESIFNSKKYIAIRKEYKRLVGEYPDEMINKYKCMVDFEPVHSFSEWRTNKELDLDKEMEAIRRNDEKSKAIIEQILSKLSEMIWQTDEFLGVIDGLGINRDEVATSIQSIKQLFWEESKFVPLEICLLKFPKSISKEKYIECRRTLSGIINENPRLMEKMDNAYFNDRVLARSVLNKHGWLLQYLPQYNDDEKLLTVAIGNDGEAIQYASKRIQKDREWAKFAIEHAERGTIMFLDCMKPYRKDKELVYLACDVERWNFVYVDKSYRDDFELAKICMKKIGDPNTIYRYLSARLKANKELVFFDLQERFPNVEEYPAKLRNDDEVAAKLYELHGLDSWGWYHMSKRLKKKYGYKEE